MGITIAASVVAEVNFAACHCGTQLIPSVNIQGGMGQEAILRIRAVPEFIYEYKEKLILSQNGTVLHNVKVQMDDAFYRKELIEAREGTIQIEVLDAQDSEKVLAFDNQPVHIQPYLHWNKSAYKETLSVFMQPNDPLVARVLNRAGELANEAGGRMAGYQQWPNTDVRKQAEWIYRAVQEEQVHYLCHPPGYEQSYGQKVRIPHHILHENVKQGTCLDLAVLYATCLEAASLHAVLFLVPGHAFAGVWLDRERRTSQYCCENWDEIKQCQSTDDGPLLPVECTFFTDGLGYTFESAVASASKTLDEHFTFALDVNTGRSVGYVPVYTYTDQPICDPLPEAEFDGLLKHKSDIKAVVAKNINFAGCRCGMPIISSIKIKGSLGQRVVCRITSKPQFLMEYKKEVSLLTASTTLKRADLKLQLDESYYRKEMVEAREGEICIEILDANEPEHALKYVAYPVHLQPYMHWDVGGYNKTLPAFMQPNDSLVARVMKRAGEYASADNNAMKGYQGTNLDVLKQAGYIYNALKDEKIHYISPPASFEAIGQKIRIPHYILQEDVKQGTCLDLAVLYASCLEAAGLHALLIITPGHAFAGVWAQSNLRLPKYCNPGPNPELVKLFQSGSMWAVECTAFTDDDIIFDEAILFGARDMTDRILQAYDVAFARRYKIQPIFAHTEDMEPEPAAKEESDPIVKEEPEQAVKEPDDTEKTEPEDKEMVDMTVSDRQTTKLDRLIKQAMDFSLKNGLLSKSALGGEIAFSIDSGKFFGDGYTEEELFLQMKQSGISEEKLEEQLYGLLSLDCQVRRECGRGMLYLAVNELEWIPKGQEESKRAPLYLCPAEVYRNMRGEYLFRANAGEVFLNPVLQELLHQDYGIDLSEMLEQPGHEYSSQMEWLTYAVGRQKDWKIAEDIAGLAAYRVPNQAIWKGLQDERLMEHDVVRGILNGTMTWNNEVPADAEEVEDPDAIYAFQADSSQNEVIRSVSRKRAQVVIGPAGNGKSQTIANIITEQMRKGKHVLFVAEKLSAMEVIASMLDTVGLSAFCLMLPDGKYSVTEVNRRIESTLRFIGNYSYKKDQAEHQEKNYREAAEKLQQYYQYMKTPGENGQSLAELLEEYEGYRELPVQINWRPAGKAMNSAGADAMMAAFAEAIRMCQVVRVVYLPYINCLDMTEEERKRAETAVDEALQQLEALQRRMHYFEVLLDIDLQRDNEKDEVKRVMTYASALLKCPVVGSSLKGRTETEDNAMRDLLNLSREMMMSTPGSYHYEDVGDRLWSQLDAISTASSDTGRDAKEWNVMEKQIFGANPGGLTMKQMEQMSQRARFDEYKTDLLKLAEGRSQEEQTALLKAADKIGCGEGETLLKAAKELGVLYKKYMEVQGRAAALVVRDGETFSNMHPNEMKAVLFREWQVCQDKIMDLKIYESACQRARAAGLGSLIRQMEDKVQKGEMSPDQIQDVFRKCRCEYNISRMRQDNPELEGFAHIDYKVCLEQYRENEKILREHVRKELLDAVVSFMPDIKEGVADAQELGILQRLIRRNSRQTSIRTLFEEAPKAMQQLFPCMLMGPASVAEYIPADAPDFDIVIFDESSQLPTYKALIPVSRGRNCLFIGDEKQLTPTTFFQKNIEDEDGTETPKEAILEDAIVTSMPQRMLRYHYRSQYESLVAFSNDRYYQGEIITFPSPDTKIEGIHYIYVEDGCYDRGGNRNNLKEGERVVALIQEIYAGMPEDTKETLGVITFNLEQMKLIKSLIRDAILANQPQSGQMAELVDVVNLEACQGKEWDITILSPAYGRDAEGNFSTNLGPMTRADGGNRLNVMITRSRKQLYVVTSMTPEMFDTEQKTGNGDVRDFLAFTRGDLKLDTRETGAGERTHGLAASVAARLEEKGYTIHTNIGSSSCKVDIGIVAEDGGSYQLGILLDHFSKDNYYVRDEEVITPGILESKGWMIYRLHAINWYENAEYEMQQIEKILVK